MTKAEINDLAVLMDSDFGIRAEDELSVWREKLRNFLFFRI